MNDHLGIYVITVGDAEIERAGGVTQALYDADMELFADLRRLQNPGYGSEEVTIVFGAWSIGGSGEYVRHVTVLPASHVSVVHGEPPAMEGGLFA